MGDDKFNGSGMVGKIMEVAIIVFFLVLLLIFFLRLYAKWFWYSVEEQLEGPNRRRRRRSDFSGGHDELANVTTILRRGLDASALKSLPVIQFDPKEFKDGLECTVCLSELMEREKTRILPRCNHGFHVQCIDMWFESHSTCPICRNPVSDKSEATSENSFERLLESPVHSSSGFPANVLFWGNEVRVNAGDPNLEDELYQVQAPAYLEPSSSISAQTVNRPDGSLAIDIPMEVNENDDQKSPITSRMASFKRLFGRDKRVNPTDPSTADVEQGSRGQS